MNLAQRRRLEWLDLDDLDAVDPSDRSWMVDAACGDRPSELFFPDGGGEDDYAPAMRVCSSCQVRLACLAAGLGEGWGCFGGTMPKDRRYIARRLADRRRGAA